MARVHITLVGGQPAPIYRAIKFDKPDIIVYIYSPQTIEEYERLCSMVNITKDEQTPLDATDPQKIIVRAEYLLNKYKDDEITINISGGSKAWSYLFPKVFGRHSNAKAVYLDQNNMYWDYSCNSGTPIVNDLSIDELISLYGNSIEGMFQKLSDYNDKDMKSLAVIKRIRSIHPQIFTSLFAAIDKKTNNKLEFQKKGSIVKDGCTVYWEKPTTDCPNAIADISIPKKDKIISYRLESPNALRLLFNSGWFEFEIASMISKWSKAKEVRMNCRFKYSNNQDKNETDIIVDTGIKLLFVECKTQIFNTTDIDKFRSVVKTYGGTASKGIFITEAKMKDVAIAKCAEHNLLSYSLQDEHFGLPEEEALMNLLDYSITEINK